MRFSEIVQTSSQVGQTRARLGKVALLAGLLARVPLEELAFTVGALSGAVAGKKLGVGYATVRGLSGVPPASAATLEVAAVARALAEIAEVKGDGSAANRRGRLEVLFSRATGEEQGFLARLLTGELRHGALEGVAVEAIAQAAQVSASSVRRALMFSGDAGEVARVARGEGEVGLARFRLTLFRPLQPMLAQPAGDPEEALREWGQASLELKVDGARVQVHKDGDEVRVFSRVGNDVSAAVPELVTGARAMAPRSLVLDGEAVSLRPDGTPQPFQVTMRRFGRKLDVKALRAEIPLQPLYFDVLHVEGEDVVDRPYRERMGMMDGFTSPEERVDRMLAASAEDVDAFYAQALSRGHEGLLIKGVDSLYEAGRRGGSWLKLKPAQTLDLVILAAEWGSGRRQGWLSNLHLGARDPADGGFVMLGKTFKGLTDAMLAWQTTWLLEHALSRDALTVYVKPELVAEIAFDSVQASPHYPGGMALRFARVKRYREDKRAAEADTVEMVRAMFQRTHGR